MSLFDQTVKLSFTSKDGEDGEPDQPYQPDGPCEQNEGKWKKPPPGPGSDSARFAPYILVSWPYALSSVERSSRVPKEFAIWSFGGFLFVSGVASGDPCHFISLGAACGDSVFCCSGTPVPTLVISYHFIASFLWAPPVATQFSVLS